jgi:fatty aldehyde-generating acyl-ACP reductase
MKFGFIYHMFFPEEALEGYGVELHKADKVIPCGLCINNRKQVEGMVADREIMTCDSTMQFTAGNGARCKGKEWTIPLTPEMILYNQNLAMEMTVKACKQAQQWGADIVGLGLMLGKIGRRGLDVKGHIDTALTNGDSYLVFHGVQVVEKLLDFFGWQPETTKIAVYGFPSTVGTYLTEFLLSQGISVVLITKQTPYIQKLIKKISCRHAAPVKLVSNFSQAQEETRIILTAGSAVQMINLAEIDDPLIVIDVSFPRNVFGESDKILVIDANAIPLPRDRLSVSGYVPDRVPTCLAELILLSFEGKKEDFSLGRTLSLERINEIGGLAKRHGFVTDILYSNDKPIEAERLNSFRNMWK